MRAKYEKFDLEAAQQGARIVNGYGKEAKLEGVHPEAVEHQRVTYRVIDTGEMVFVGLDGKYGKKREDRPESRYDLRMLASDRSLWVNFYPEGAATYAGSKSTANRMHEAKFALDGIERIGDAAFEVPNVPQ